MPSKLERAFFIHFVKYAPSTYVYNTDDMYSWDISVVTNVLMTARSSWIKELNNLCKLYSDLTILEA